MTGRWWGRAARGAGTRASGWSTCSALGGAGLHALLGAMVDKHCRPRQMLKPGEDAGTVTLPCPCEPDTEGDAGRDLGAGLPSPLEARDGGPLGHDPAR